LRGRYGTAFKVPTLSDEFQLPSGYYSSVTDYLNCGRQGHGGADIADCTPPYNSVQFNGQTYGNPALQPITAKVWTYGFVWAPTAKLSFNVDYLHWDINNEVSQVSADTLSHTEYLCDIGTLNMNSETCRQAFALITRGPGVGPYLGNILRIATPKLNVANEQVNAITAGFQYVQGIGALGRLSFAASYSDELKHTYQDYPTDKPVDLLRHPGWSTDFKSKVNGSLTWNKNDWSATVYFNRYGRTPNNAAASADNYTDPRTGKLPAWTLYNASVTYNPVKNLGLSLLVNNLFDKMPPRDPTYNGLTGTPYNIFNYNVFGRAIYLEANYKFGDE
jgi:outer membrane receptor protein involved in Fe transport